VRLEEKKSFGSIEDEVGLGHYCRGSVRAVWQHVVRAGLTEEEIVAAYSKLPPSAIPRSTKI
jgi:hypothetical protein